MKIAVSGKGGVGKTTLTALLSHEAVAAGYRVFAIDADPNPGLATALHFPSIPSPLVDLKEIIAERVGTVEGFFRLNPRVDDIPQEFSVEHDGIRLMVMGGIRQGGAGCACPENTFLRSLLQHVLFDRDEWVLVDCEAGLEHFGRATARGVDKLLVVVEPDLNSVETAYRIRKLAGDIGITRIHIIGNKIRDAEDAEFLKRRLGDQEPLALLPETPAVRQKARSASWSQPSELAVPIRKILDAVQKTG
jgi:CO dehydrogenase maturation factor